MIRAGLLGLSSCLHPCSFPFAGAAWHKQPGVRWRDAMAGIVARDDLDAMPDHAGCLLPW
jgi:hypothetical protein